MNKWLEKESWWLIALALPFLQIKNIFLYASTKTTKVAKIATVISFLPITLFVTALWVGLWAIFLTTMRYLLG